MESTRVMCPTCRELDQTSRVFVLDMDIDPLWIRKAGYYDERGNWVEEGMPNIELASTTFYRCSNGHNFWKYTKT